MDTKESTPAVDEAQLRRELAIAKEAAAIWQNRAECAEMREVALSHDLCAARWFVGTCGLALVLAFAVAFGWASFMVAVAVVLALLAVAVVAIVRARPEEGEGDEN